jgi:hypothetical protein
MNHYRYRDPLDVDPLPVSIVKSPEELTSLGVEFGGASYFPVPLIGSAAPVQLLQRRPTRYKGVISLDSLTVTTTPVVAIILGATTVAAYNPNPVGVLATITGGTVTVISVNGTVTGLTSGTIYVPAGGTIAITYTVAPALTTAYPPGVTVAASVATSVVLAHRPDYLANPANPQGFYISAAPKILQWENQQPCYAVAIGAGPVIVSVIDQAQSAGQAQAEELVQSGGYSHDESDQEEGSGNYVTTGNAY